MMSKLGHIWDQDAQGPFAYEISSLYLGISIMKIRRSHLSLEILL